MQTTADSFSSCPSTQTVYSYVIAYKLHGIKPTVTFVFQYWTLMSKRILRPMNWPAHWTQGSKHSMSSRGSKCASAPVLDS